MERLDGAGLQEVPEEARSLTSRAACCQSAIRRVESPLCCSHARQGLTSRHGFTPKRVNRVNPVTTSHAQQHPNGSPQDLLSGALGIQPLACWPHCPYTTKIEATAAEKGWHRNYGKANNGCGDAPCSTRGAVVPLPALFTRSCCFHHALSTTSSATRATKSLQ